MVPALGLVILALAVFAALNVELLEAWGAGLAGRFHGGLSLPVTILVVFLAGVLTSLTPCVYPVIPLAITYLGARSATSRLKAFSLAAAYVAGMVVCYTILGAAAGLTGTTFGAATQKWWVYAGVATIVAVFGLSMLGLFNISLPSGLQRLAGRSKGPGYRGAFLMGATSGLVTAPCTAPVLGTLIIPMISNRSVALGSMLLAVFGLGMGMLFLVVGTYSGVLSSLPRSGTWMNAVKYALGAAILLVAVFFFYKAWVMFPLRASGTQAARGPVATDSAGGARLPGLPGGRSRPAAAPRLVLATALAPFGAASGSERRQAPDFAIDDVKGRHHDLARYRGKTLHLAFFALWCPPCLEQMRRIEVADARLRARGYAVLAVGLKDREDNEALRAFASEGTVGFPVAWDEDGAMARAFGVTSIPAHVIVGPDGKIVYEGRNLPEGFETNGAGILPE